MVAVGERLGAWAQIGLSKMKAIRIHVENDRISGDAPPGSPEGNVDLVLADGDDEMTNDELSPVCGERTTTKCHSFAAVGASTCSSTQPCSSDRRSPAFCQDSVIPSLAVALPMTPDAFARGRIHSDANILLSGPLDTARFEPT